MPISFQRLASKLQTLRADPGTFLIQHVLHAPGGGAGAPGASTVINVHFYKRDGVGTRPGSYLKVLSRPFHAAPEFVIQCADPNLVVGEAVEMHQNHYRQNVPFDAHWIATSAYPEPDLPPAPQPPFPWYTLPQVGGPDYMFTQRLTGCSFLYRAAGGGFEVAHIMPQPDIETGADLETRLRARFPEATIFGRSRYNQDREVTIVGVRNEADGWRFFAQKRDLLSLDVRSARQF